MYMSLKKIHARIEVDVLSPWVKVVDSIQRGGCPDMAFALVHMTHHIIITLFKSIIMLCGTGKIMQNIPTYHTIYGEYSMEYH